MPDSSSIQRLPGWLRPVELEDPGPRQEAIASAARTVAESSGAQNILDLVVLAYGRPSAASQPLADAIRELDPTFGGQPDDLETHIAAAATVAVLIDDPSTCAVAGAAV